MRIFKLWKLYDNNGVCVHIAALTEPQLTTRDGHTHIIQIMTSNGISYSCAFNHNHQLYSYLENNFEFCHVKTKIYVLFFIFTLLLTLKKHQKSELYTN